MRNEAQRGMVLYHFIGKVRLRGVPKHAILKRLWIVSKHAALKLLRGVPKQACSSASLEEAN